MEKNLLKRWEKRKILTPNSRLENRVTCKKGERRELSVPCPELQDRVKLKERLARPKSYVAVV